MILEKSLYRGDNSHFTNRFCKDELDPKFQQFLLNIFLYAKNT